MKNSKPLTIGSTLSKDLDVECEKFNKPGTLIRTLREVTARYSSGEGLPFIEAIERRTIACVVSVEMVKLGITGHKVEWHDAVDMWRPSPKDVAIVSFILLNDKNRYRVLTKKLFMGHTGFDYWFEVVPT